jgi:hypothetical protein
LWFQAIAWERVLYGFKEAVPFDGPEEVFGLKTSVWKFEA